MDLKEKYRPTSFDSPWLIRTEAINRVMRMHPNYPHLLFSGPPGTGKTTLARIIAKELHGDDYEDYMLFIDGSDDTSVEVVRGKIKDFARSYAPSGSRRVIILDEAEYMSPNAQNALRGMMERYVDNVLFILTCNNVNKIINALKSDSNGRCLHIKFSEPEDDAVINLAMRIARAEGIVIEDDAISVLVRERGAHIRTVLNVLQACNGVLRANDIEVIGDAGARIFNFINSGNVVAAINEANKIDKHKLSSSLFDYVIKSDMGITKVDIIKLIAEYDYRCAIGANITIQTANLIYSIAYILLTRGGDNER